MSGTTVWRSGGMPALMALTFAGFAGYAALVSVAPLWAVHGGSGPGGAGLVNAVLLLTTVVVQFFVPAALARFGHAAVLVAGLAFLGVPSLGYAVSDDLAPILVMSALRGVGFAVLTVAGSAITARLVPPERLGAAVGAYGLAVAAPMTVLLPASVPIYDRLGPVAAFALGALPLLGIPAAIPVGRRVEGLVEPSAQRMHVDPGVRSELVGALASPMAILLSVTLVGGALMTFLPQQIESSGAAALTLLVFTVTTALARWRIGSWADRSGPRTYLVPLLVTTAASTVAVAWWVRVGDGAPLALLLGAVAVVGVGYGALQNLTLLVAFQAVGPRRINEASAGWNMGFDGGTALGSLVTGYVAAGFSFPVAYLTLALMTLSATLAVRGVAR